MTDTTKSRQELIDELNALRRENRELKQTIDETAPDREAAPEPESGGKPAILIVDDNEHTRSIVADMLEEIGYTSISATAAEEALDCVKAGKQQISLIISDIVMPGTDGPDMMQAILAINPEIQVIFMSGYAEDEIVHDSVYKIQDSAAAFLKKPFTLTELKTLVNTRLGE